MGVTASPCRSAGRYARVVNETEEMKMNYAVVQRMRLIDFLLQQYGYINRSALENYYGISTPQASSDIKAYMKMAPNNARYDASAKRYEVKPTFEPYF